MGKWSEVQTSKAYQELSLPEQFEAKREFHDNVILNSPKYKVLPPEQQKATTENFLRGGDELEKLRASAIQQKEKVQRDPTTLPGAIRLGDIAVERVAKAIEPKVPAGRTTAGIFFKDFLLRQLPADFARAYKPTNIANFAALSFLLGPTAKAAKKPLTRFATKRIPKKVQDFFLREFTVGGGAPKQFLAASKKAKLAREAGAREAQEVAKTLSTDAQGKPLELAKQRAVGRIFRKEIDLGGRRPFQGPNVFDRKFTEQIRGNPQFKELSGIANAGRDVMDKWSKELARSGVPSKKAQRIIEDNVGEYMARMFPKTVASAKRRAGQGGALRLRLDGLKRRKQLTSDVLNALDEIREPALPTAIRVGELSTTVANQKLFKTVAANPEWVAAANLTGKMVKMADTPAMGALRSKWVIPEIARDINSIHALPNVFTRNYMKALSAWKYGKVVLNPATHARNMMTNTMLLDFSGVSHRKQLLLYPKVMRDYLTKGQNYKLAVKHGAIGGEFVGGEVSRLRNYYLKAQGNNFSKWMATLKAPFKAAGRVYQAEEQLSKMVKFTDMLERGATPEIAAKEAQKWLFNYTEIPNVIKFVREIPIGAPFATFTYKAIPRVGETLAKNPMRIYKYKALFDSFNSASSKLLNMDPEQFAREKNALPPWLLRDLGGVPMTLLLPWKDKHGRTQWVNLEYILPLGMGPEALKGGPAKLVGNPVATLTADLLRNRDFKGKDIIPIGATKEEATAAITNHVYRQLVPSLAPGLKGVKGWGGGYSFSKILNAANDIPDYADRTRNVPLALMDTLVGIKITPVDVNESEMFKQFKKRDLMNAFRKQILQLRHPAISDEFKAKRAEELFKRMQRMLSE